ncbi:hypothetical protein [Neolewinella litorea]|uniref:Capsule polysaccharide biosynthesis protein n=1 Tax=Neolewinella litorea TaxID=2562452 RepID=A0A4S4N996_9BACT|nr:hypothetical protein [Neolewinella litorea]THH34571.1 hypothetical protein E4021_17565 [Neolewinella litorea]
MSKKITLAYSSWKDVIKLHIFPVLATLGHKLGYSWKSLGRSFLGKSVLIAQASHISGSFNTKQSEKKLDIYFLSMLGNYTHNIMIDIALAWGLIQRGHNVSMVLDDMCLPITEAKRNGEENRWDIISARGYLFGKRYFDAAGLKVIYLSDVVDKEAEVDVTEFQSIVDASILKHYRVGVISESLPNIESKRDLIKTSVAYTSQLGSYLLSLNPDRIILNHGIYSTWGPPFEILNKHNIPIVTYSKTKRKKTEKFNWNSTADWWDVSEEWERVRGEELTVAQHQKIDKYLASRVKHEDDVLVYNFGEKESKQQTFNRFGLDPLLPVFSLFTNVLWDAASAQREIVFDNPINWVFETIEYFLDKPHIQLIVKIHPAEVVIGTNQPFSELINERFEYIPANIVIIEPQENVNSWSIYEITSMGLVHTTTAGMELPLLGIPCAVVSRTHYRGKGFTIDVNSKEEYFNLLSSYSPKQPDKNKLMALSKRYAHLLFERYQIPFEIFDEITYTDVRSFNFDNIKELFEIPHFEYIIDAIIHKKPFLTDIRIEDKR